MNKPIAQAPLGAMLQDVGTEAGTKACYFDVAALAGYGDDKLSSLVPEADREQWSNEYKGLGRTYPIVLSPEMTVLKYIANPNVGIGPHHHGVNQLIYVLKGELHMGTNVLTAGMGYYHPAKKYSWKSGPEGVEFLEVYSGYPASPITK